LAHDWWVFEQTKTVLGNDIKQQFFAGESWISEEE